MATINQTVSGGTTNGDILPSATGQNLGSSSQLWNAFIQTLSIQKIGSVRQADQFTGANAGAKIIAALADLPSTGGIVDARAFEGAQAITSTILVSTNQIVLLGNATFTCSTTPAFVLGGTAAGVSGNGASLIGNGISNTKLLFTGTGASQKYGVGITSCSGFNSTDNHVEGMTIDMQGTATSTYDLALGGAWHPVVRNVLLLGASVAQGAGLFIGTANIYADSADGGSYFGNFENVFTGNSGHANYFGIQLKGQATTGNNFHTFKNCWATYNSSTGIYLTSANTAQAVSGTQFVGGGSSYNLNNGLSIEQGAMDVLLSAFDIESNSSWGITNTTDTVSIVGQNVFFNNNTSGSFQKSAQYIDLIDSGLHEVYSGSSTPNTPTKSIIKTANSGTFSAGVEQRTPPLEWDLTSLLNIYLEAVHATNDGSYIRFTDSTRTKAMWFDAALGRMGWNYSAGVPAQFWTPGTTGTITFPSASDTLVGKTTTDTLTNKTLGSTGTVVTKLAKYTASLTPASVAANTTAEQTFTVTGVAAADMVLSVNKPTAQAGLGIVGWRATAINTVGITFSNNTASPIVPTASETYSFAVLQ